MEKQCNLCQISESMRNESEKTFLKLCGQRWLEIIDSYYFILTEPVQFFLESDDEFAMDLFFAVLRYLRQDYGNKHYKTHFLSITEYSFEKPICFITDGKGVVITLGSF